MRKPVLTMCFLVLVSAFLTACAASTGTSNGGSSGGKVTYDVTGTTKASITYTDGSTKTSQETEATVPWSRSTPEKSNAIVYQVMAQNSMPGGKTIKCSITHGGKVVDSNEGKGEFAIAQCQWQP